MYEDFYAIRTLVETTKRWSENANDRLWCEKCRSINFSDLLYVHYRPTHQTHDTPPKVLRHNCGSVGEIRQRKIRCKFCAFVIMLLERDQGGSLILPHYQVHFQGWPYFSAKFKKDEEGQGDVVLHLSKLLVRTQPSSRTSLQDLPEPYGSSFWLQVFDLPLPRITGEKSLFEKWHLSFPIAILKCICWFQYLLIL